MAGGFLRALAKMKLVELDEAEAARANKAAPSEIDMAEVDRILAEEEKRSAQQSAPAAAPPRSRPAPAAPPPQQQRGQAPAPAHAPMPAAPAAAAPAAPRGGGGLIQEGQPFEQYYAQAGVAPGPYPAEKLLRVLDGLRAMDPHTRKAAVLAMDAADDAWSIADVVVDAQRKLRVLGDTQQRLQGAVQAQIQHAQVEKQKLDAYLASATETIRRKIGELEQTLQKETAEATAAKAQLDLHVHDADAACRREIARAQTEMERLQEICATFIVERRSG